MLVLARNVLEVGMGASPTQARVLVVSPSAYMRYVISGELSSTPDLFVVGTALTCEEIAEKQALLRPDVVVVDVDSRRDLSNLRRTLAQTQSPVLALCAQSQGGELAFAALEAGAADVVARSETDRGKVLFVPDLSRKVRGLARARRYTGG
jgi:chemotaxis response regulator CheB